MAEASIPTQKIVRLANIKCSEVHVILKKHDLIVVIIIVARMIYNEILNRVEAVFIKHTLED